MSIKKFNHNKFKNIGLIFEILVAKITSEVINNNSDNNALKILKHCFKKDSLIAEELSMYKALLEAYQLQNKAITYDLINKIIENYKKLDKEKLDKEKYSLINNIKRHYNLNELSQSRINSYKEYATIYKLFNYTLDDNPSEYSKLKNHILEYNLQDSNINNIDTIQESLQKSLPEDNDIKILTYKLMIKKFNKKYSSLDENQQRLLKEYITNVANSKELTDFIKKELESIIVEINKKNVTNDVLKVKINEVTHLFENIKNKYIIDDEDVTILMNGYELLKNIK